MICVHGNNKLGGSSIMKSYNNEKEILETVEELAEEATTESVEPSTVLGMVTECVKLRVRSTPEIADNVLAEIILASEVLVDLKESTDEFYKITTEAGIEGYCMKQYIDIGD